MRSGVIDIGSNSIKLLIGESSGDSFTIIESLKNVIPLANDTFSKGRISQSIINQSLSILEKYKRVLQDYDVTDITVIATTAVREADNREMFVDTVMRKTGLSIDILTVGDIVYYIDAYLSHKLKDSYPIHEKNILIAELGSGSLDVSVMEQGLSIMHAGLPLGVLRLKQFMSRFDAGGEDSFKALTEYISSEFDYLERSLPKLTLHDILLIDENYSSFIPCILDKRGCDSRFFQLSIDEAQDLLKRIVDKSATQLNRSYKVPADIADTMVAYAIILNAVFTLIQNDHIYILEVSLSEAIMANKLLEMEISKKYNKTNQLVSLATAICKKYAVDMQHAKQVAALSEDLFVELKDVLGLKKDNLLYLTMAAYLHDIGAFIHNRAHHKHSEYIINSLNISRLKEEDVRLIACIARYHRKAIPSSAHPLYGALPQEQKILVQKLSAILRLANSLDRSHKQKIKKVEVRRNAKQELVIAAFSQENCLFEQQDFNDKKEMMEDIAGSKVSLVIKS
jgi:exopolyphosphatase/guanosine-5'-triphosphate,3'-diphosphate pyrophosphatase